MKTLQMRIYSILSLFGFLQARQCPVGTRIGIDPNGNPDPNNNSRCYIPLESADITSCNNAMDGSAEMAIKINRDFWDANGGDPSGFELIGSNYVKVGYYLNSNDSVDLPNRFNER